MLTKGLKNAELAVLSLVAERDMHGYEMEGLIGERGMREWTEIGFSSIYRVLAVLARRGLVEGTLVPAPGKGAARRVYHITAAGKREYLRGVRAALAEPLRLFPLLQLGLAGLPAVAPAEAAADLERYARSLGERRAGVQARGRRRNPFHVQAMFEYSVKMIGAEEEFVKDLARRLRARGREGRT
jgi:DNA-binding PadR family transcriptional regulator